MSRTDCKIGTFDLIRFDAKFVIRSYIIRIVWNVLSDMKIDKDGTEKILKMKY